MGPLTVVIGIFNVVVGFVTDSPINLGLGIVCVLVGLLVFDA